MITEHRELHGAAGGTGTGAGGAGAGAGAGGGSSAGGVITVWALTAQLLHALVCHERIRIDLEGAIVGELLGDRLWKVSLALLRRTFGAPTATPWSDSARELFETVRVLATTLHRLPELVDVSLDLLTSLRERHAAAASAYPAPRAVGAGVATSAAAAAVTPPTTISEPTPPWLLLDFLQQVGEACAEESTEETTPFVNFATCGCVPAVGAGADGPASDSAALPSSGHASISIFSVSLVSASLVPSQRSSPLPCAFLAAFSLLFFLWGLILRNKF
jgi:hypothetical protein